MGYVEQNLMPGESVIYRARLHWAVFLPSIFFFVVAIWLFSVGGDSAPIGALVLLFIALPTLFYALLLRRTSEFAVTNKRVLIKSGLIGRLSLETLLNKIESIAVDQGIIGRMLNYGTIIVSGTGGSKEPFHRIADPMQFRRQVQQQIAALEEPRGSRNAVHDKIPAVADRIVDTDQSDSPLGRTEHRLKELSDLRAKNLINEEEYQQRRTHILNEL